MLHYYLADDTIEILEEIAPNSGRDAPSIFLKRQKLPRGTPPMPLPGQRTSRTVLNVFGPMGHGGRHLLDRYWFLLSRLLFLSNVSLV